MSKSVEKILAKYISFKFYYGFEECIKDLNFVYYERIKRVIDEWHESAYGKFDLLNMIKKELGQK